MNDVHWYIQDANLPERGTLHRIAYIIEEMGMTVHSRPYIPFGGMDYSFLPTDKPVVALGSISMAKDHQRRLQPHRPFVWFDHEKLKCSRYFAHYDQDLVSSDYLFLPYATVLSRWDRLFTHVLNCDEIFIKPDTNDKVFNATLVRHDGKEGWKATVERFGDDMTDQLCMISRPKKIIAEWRLFVADGKVIAGSKYKENGMICKEAGYPQGAASLVENLFAVWTPHPILCMDVASTSRGYQLVEIGSANCAGFYECDLPPIVKTMAEIAWREF